MIKIQKMMEFEFDKPEMIVYDEKDWQALQLPREVYFCIDKGELLVSFYSNINPSLAARHIDILHRHGLKDFYLSGNIYPNFNKKSEFQEMLFDDDADQKYYEDVYEDMKKKIDFMRMVPTAGTKQ